MNAGVALADLVVGMALGRTGGDHGGNAAVHGRRGGGLRRIGAGAAAGACATEACWACQRAAEAGLSRRRVSNPVSGVDSDFEKLAAHVRYRIGSHVQYCQEWRINELLGLVIRHWPHAHLEAVLTHGRLHKAIDHAMILVRAQVREQWEARHGIGPLWGLALAPAVAAISHCLLDLWFQSAGWRGALKVMGRKQ